MEKTRRNVKLLLKLHPEGIPLSKLTVFYSQRFHRNLTLADLGFGSISAFVASLSDDLVVNDGTVFYSAHWQKVQDSEDTVELIKSCPEGVLLNKLEVAFTQRYKRNITLSALGFSSVADFIESLNKDLLVRGNVVYHRSHNALKGSI